MQVSPSSLKEELRASLPAGHKWSKQMDSAFNLAYEAHRGQYRTPRNSGDIKLPYILHPVGVAKNVSKLWGNIELEDSFEDLISSALTHDVLEDCDVDLGTLVAATSRRASDIVLSLTKPLLSSTSSREGRNTIFLSQIKSAGKSSIFLKLCDVAHNLSRPNNAPNSLLAKTINKAKNEYLPLADGLSFEEQMTNFLVPLIKRAEIVQAKRNVPSNAKNYQSYDSYLSYCLRASEEKVLEAHDIASCILLIKGVARVEIMTATEFIEGGFSNFMKNTLDAPEIDKLKNDLANGYVALANYELAGSDSVISEMYVIPLTHLGTDSSLNIFIGLSKSKAKWINMMRLRSIIAILTERINIAGSRRLMDYSEKLHHLGLHLSAGLALEIGYSNEELIYLKRKIDAATYASDTIEKCIRGILRHNNIDKEIDRIEKRVKSANSIVKKIKNRKNSSMDEIDDLIGFRIVVLSTGSVCKVIHSIKRDLAVFLVNIEFKDLQEKEITSSDGYHAIHVKFIITTQSIDATYELSCEIQLRTVFQDAWARLSQIISYKQIATSKKEHAILRELSAICISCDELAINLEK